MQQPYEGYIKFEVHWSPAPAWKDEDVADLNEWRAAAYQHELIGVYPDGVGYGNISKRWEEGNQFLISGSATGHLPRLTAPTTVWLLK